MKKKYYRLETNFEIFQKDGFGNGETGTSNGDGYGDMHEFDGGLGCGHEDRYIWRSFAGNGNGSDGNTTGNSGYEWSQGSFIIEEEEEDEVT